MENNMTDLSDTIIAKSDQLNGDDLMGGAMTIKITAVKKIGGEQPVAICYEGDNGKPWKPCKSMMRVLVAIWGKNGDIFVGRSLTLFRDEKVTWAGMAVGGIRISHMSHINTPFTMALTATRGNKKPYVVKPLVVENTKTTITPEELEILKGEGHEFAEQGVEKLGNWWKALGGDKQKALGAEFIAKLKVIANEADSNVI